MIPKLMSGRFWAIIMITFTYCWIVMITTRAYLERANPDKMEGFAMGLVMGFSSFAVKALIEYFGKDRTPFNPVETGGTK